MANQQQASGSAQQGQQQPKPTPLPQPDVRSLYLTKGLGPEKAEKK